MLYTANEELFKAEQKKEIKIKIYTTTIEQRKQQQQQQKKKKQKTCSEKNNDKPIKNKTKETS